MVPGSCHVGCSFCPGKTGKAPGSAVADLAARLDEAGRVERLSLMGSDLLRHPDRDALLEVIADRTAPPRVYLYTPWPAGAALASAERQPVVSGLIIPFVRPTRRMSPTAHRPAAVIAAAMRVNRRLEIVPHFYLGDLNAAILPTFARVIHQHVPFQTAAINVSLGLGRRGHQRLSDLAECFVGLHALSEELGLRFTLPTSTYPPPCVADLHTRAPSLYARVLHPDRPERPRNTALPQCAECTLATRCRWRADAYIARHGTGEFVPIRTPRPTWRHVSEFDPDHLEGAVMHRWYVRRDELPPCSLPWSSLEMLGVSSYTALPCNADYLKHVPPSVAPLAAFEEWNGPLFRRMRASLSRDGGAEVCQPHCMRRHRAARRTHRDGFIAIDGRAPAFLANRLRHFQELLAGAVSVRAKPQSLTISPTWACNFSCDFCHTTPVRAAHPRQDLGPAYYERLRDYLPYLAELNVSGAGEPLLSRPFRDFLTNTDFSPYPDLGLTITTNGSPLTPAFIDRLYGVPLRGLIISLNAASAATHREVSGSDTYARVWANIEHLLANRHRFAAGPPLVQLSFVVMRSNFRDLPAFVALGERDGLRVILTVMEVDSHNQRHSLTTAEAPPEELAEALALIDRLRGDYRHNAVTSQYLDTLRQSLSDQRRYHPSRDIEVAPPPGEVDRRGADPEE